jgi:3-oxoacyl-[acyl-carrier protein] reductase
VEKMTKKLNGRISIITGASRSQGIGAAICKALANEGADIFFTHWREYDRRMDWGAEEEWPEHLSKELSNFGVKTSHMEADLSDPNMPFEIMNKVQERMGTPSILVNNATHDTGDGFRKLNARILDDHYNVNIRGTCLLSVEFAKQFEKNFDKHYGGRIINMISSGPLINSLSYVATKGAILAITEPLSVALAPLGITVNCIDPGPTDTGWMNEEVKGKLLPRFPMGRLGLPEDAAKLVKFLASEESQWITGQRINSEGGYVGR